MVLYHALVTLHLLVNGDGHSKYIALFFLYATASVLKRRQKQQSTGIGRWQAGANKTMTQMFLAQQILFLAVSLCIAFGARLFVFGNVGNNNFLT